MPMMFHSQENTPESQTDSQNTAQPYTPAHVPGEAQAQPFAPTNASVQQERRYDPDTLRRMTALATRMQHDHYDKITAGEMESIGAEVGLKPEFVQQALAQMDAEHAHAEQEQRQQTEQQAAQQAEQYTLQQRKLQQKQHVQTGKTLNQTQATGTKTEFYSVCAALAAPLLFGLLAYHFKSAAHFDYNTGMFTLDPRANAIQLFTLIAPVPLALLQGFAAGKRRVGFMAAAALIFALAPTVPFLGAVSAEQYQVILTDILSHLPEMVAYTLLAVPIAGAFGVMGAWMRQRYFPFAGSRTQPDAQAAHQNGQQNIQQNIQHKDYGSAPYGSAQYAPAGPQNVPYQQPFAPPAPHMMPAAHGQAMHLTPGAYAHAYLPYQNQAAANPARQTAPGTTHAAQSVRRAYLSVDVADLDSLRQSATLAAVDYSFGQLRAWTEAIVHICGGSVHHDANVGLLASFPTDAQAARAARLMQERVGEFNHALNRLPVPFRLRCGLSAGESASVVNNAVRERSQSLLRTARAGDTLVGSEMGAAILSEMGPVAPASSVGVADAFVWRPEQAAPPAH